MRGLNPDHLHAFREVVERGTFSAAAAHLSLTQPAVSLQIRQLERRLDVRLLERVGRRVRPTAAGDELLQHARELDLVAARAIAAMATHRRKVIARVRLGTGATACIYLLPPILRRLRQRFPGLEIVVSTGNTPDIARQIEQNSLDVALVTLPAPGRNLDVTAVLDDELLAVFPADGAKPPRIATAAALSVNPLVFYEAGGHTRRIIDDWFLRANLSLRPVMELGSVEAIKRLVAAGLGCAVLPSLAVAESRSRDKIITRPLAPRLHRTLGIVLRRDKPLDRGLREVVQALKALSPR
jgi:DNA-binding transcriptional LysR family regulator